LEKELKYRLPARKLSIRKRFYALTTNERQRAIRLRRLALALLCWNYFEFRQADLYRLRRRLHFPNSCKLENNSRMSGEEVLLQGLYELVSGEDQLFIAAIVFGRDQSQCC
jgi:hypothetical protein